MIRALFRRYRKDDRGVAAIEFALIAPVMVLMYFGLVELCQAMIAERKANHVASAVGDLVAQVDTVTAANVDDIFTVGNTIMSPFPVGTLQMRVTSAIANSSGVPKVDWSRGSGGFSPMAVGATATVPLTLASGDSIVIAEAKYSYTSVVRYVLPNALNYSETYYLRPRRSDKVTCTGC